MHRLADDVVAAEREAEVRDAARRAHTGASLLDQRQALEERAGIVVVLFDPGRDGEHVRVEHDVLRNEPHFVHEQPVGALADLEAALDRRRLPLLVERHHDHAGAVVAHAPRVVEELRLAFLERDRVDDPFALDRLEPRLEDAPFRAVDHHGQARHLGLGGDHVQERPHRLLAFEEVGVHVHVDQVRAAAHLLERDVDGGREVAGLDEAAEARRTGDVRALADQDEAGVGRDRERLEAAEARAAPPRRDLSRGQSPGRGRNRPRVLRRRAAARADDVEEAVPRELVQERRRDVGRLVVAAERVRQPRVRVRRGQAVRDLRQLGDVRPHLARAERAVDANDQRVGVLDRRPEAFDRLTRQRPAGQIDDRDADPQRELRRRVARSDDRRLRVQRVEDRLDQEHVDPAVAQAAHLLGVALDDLVERVRAVRRVVDTRAERQRHVQRPDRAGDEAVGPCRLARDPRALDVHVVHRVLEPVVRLPDRGRRERVRRRDVGARREVRVVHLAHDVGPRQVEQVGVVLDVTRMRREALTAEVGLGEASALEEDAPRPVEHEDPLGCEAAYVVGDVSHSSLGVW